MRAEAHCPLCAAGASVPFHRDRRRPYRRCGRCALVFVPEQYRLDRAAEFAEYERHENDPTDPGYRRFLARLAVPLLERVAVGERGLDFGCGPGPALARMLTEAGCEVSLYDSFYHPRRDLLSGCYDFITATEVVEHLHHPGRELALLWSLLRPGGWLAIMTKQVLDADTFAGWHYKNDPTHVCFFSRSTWLWWAAQRDCMPEFLGADVILLQKAA